MIDLYNGEITDIMPDNLKYEPIVQALSYAISNTVKKTINMSLQTSVYGVIDILDEPIVDLLAVELRTQYYDNFLTLNEKREMIKKTLLWYYRAGTLSTVQELTDFVYENAKIEEWFQYGSSAYLFRLIVQVINQEITLEKYLKYIQSLYDVKNTRSHLEAVIFKHNTDANVKSLAMGGEGIHIKVKMRTVKRIKALAERKAVTAVKIAQIVRIKAGIPIKGGKDDRRYNN